VNGDRSAGTGDWGEDAALQHLERQGLELLCRNFRRRFGEIDLVMREPDCLVFIEVRVRRNRAFGDGIASITRVKRQRLARAARAYLQTRPDLDALPGRFDVVAVSSENGQTTCTWMTDAFGMDE
jgi:putative endonuclease